MKRLFAVAMLALSGFLFVQPVSAAAQPRRHRDRQCFRDCKRAYKDCKRHHGRRCGELRRDCERGCHR